MRVHRAWFARLRLVATAIRAVRLACRSPPRVARPAIPPLPAGQVATCAAALPPVPAWLPRTERCFAGSLSPAGETDLMPVSRVLRDPQAAKFPGARVSLQTPEPEQCAHTRQAHPVSVGIYPHRL